MTATPSDPDVMAHPDFNKNDASLNFELTNRVFNIRVKRLMKDIKEDKVLGNASNIIFVTEFQKRGLPHIHMVVTLDTKVSSSWMLSLLYICLMHLIISQMETPDDVDGFVSCELPDPDLNPELHRRVTKYMLHNCNGRCLDKDGRCKKGFPHSFREETVMNDGKGWIGLKRARGGATFTKGGTTYDTRHVVPYNPFLLMRYDCHLNVLPFNNLRQARYLFKYICKGVDCACVERTFKLFDHVINVCLILAPTCLSLHRFVSCPQNPDHPSRTDKTFAAMKVVPKKPGEGEGSYVLIDQLSFIQDMQYMTAPEAHWHLSSYNMHYSMFSVSAAVDVV